MFHCLIVFLVEHLSSIHALSVGGHRRKSHGGVHFFLCLAAVFPVPWLGFSRTLSSFLPHLARCPTAVRRPSHWSKTTVPLEWDDRSIGMGRAARCTSDPCLRGTSRGVRWDIRQSGMMRVMASGSMPMVSGKWRGSRRPSRSTAALCARSTLTWRVR